MAQKSVLRSERTTPISRIPYLLEPFQRPQMLQRRKEYASTVRSVGMVQIWQGPLELRLTGKRANTEFSGVCIVFEQAGVFRTIWNEVFQRRMEHASTIRGVGLYRFDKACSNPSARTQHSRKCVLSVKELHSSGASGRNDAHQDWTY